MFWSTFKAQFTSAFIAARQAAQAVMTEAVEAFKQIEAQFRPVLDARDNAVRNFRTARHAELQAVATADILAATFGPIPDSWDNSEYGRNRKQFATDPATGKKLLRAAMLAAGVSRDHPRLPVLSMFEEYKLKAYAQMNQIVYAPEVPLRHFYFCHAYTINGDEPWLVYDPEQAKALVPVAIEFVSRIEAHPQIYARFYGAANRADVAVNADTLAQVSTQRLW